MDSPRVASPETEVENRIVALLSARLRMMFSDIAKALPDCTWQMLFGALSRLSKQRHVELLAHRWDYEVIFLNVPSSNRGASVPHRADDPVRT